VTVGAVAVSADTDLVGQSKPFPPATACSSSYVQRTVSCR